MSESWRPNTRARAGFSLVELIMALLVLALGVLGLSTSTLLVTRQLTLAEITTFRAAAVQSTLERIRATPFDSLSMGSDSIGPMLVTWTAIIATTQSTDIEIVTVGPGLASASTGLGSVTDTVVFRVLRP
jgi:prepilin-type N-terminal cleavage/methylation domain-containing protein